MTEPIRIPIELDLTDAIDALRELGERLDAAAMAESVAQLRKLNEAMKANKVHGTAIMAEFFGESRAASAFPLSSIQLLLDMVRGTIPFSLVPAIKAALAIGEYVASVFDAKTEALPIKPTPQFGLEQALAACTEPGIKSVGVSLLTFILAEVMKWIGEQVAK